jgi:sirohydrochlorin ferrochelatase
MHPAQPHKSPVCILFDNGSLRPNSTQSLRATARKLAVELGIEVRAVSLLHSSAVNPSELGGKPAQLLEPALTAFLEENGAAGVVALPLFFGPSAALTDYVPARLAVLASKFPRAQIRLARWLIDPSETDNRVAQALAKAARRVIITENLVNPKVVLVDHGSPQCAVTEVRNFLGEQLRALLADVAAEVTVASMEKRPGADYAFNDPLLAQRLRTPPFDRGDVVVALQFLSPGRHAGQDGDVAWICAEARSERSELRTYLTETIASDQGVIAVLADRYKQALRPVT